MSNAALKILIAVALAAFVALRFMRTRQAQVDDYEEPEQALPPSMVETAAAPADIVRGGSRLLEAVQLAASDAPASTSTSLLPKPCADGDASCMFAPDPGALTGQNFVDASRWVSMGTLHSRRNANRQLRADIPIPKNNGVSPWSQSTIENNEEFRKPLE